jgi:hypothetical protein
LKNSHECEGAQSENDGVCGEGHVGAASLGDAGSSGITGRAVRSSP